MDMMGLIALRFEEKEAHRVVVGVLGVFVRLLPRWVGFVDVQPLLFGTQTQNPVKILLRLLHERPNRLLRRALSDKVTQIIHRTIGFVEIELPARAIRAVSIRHRTLLDNKAGGPITLIRCRYRSSKARDSGTRHDNIVFPIPFFFRRSRIGPTAGAPRKTKSSSTGQSQTCALQETAARRFDPFSIHVRRHKLSLHIASLSISIANPTQPAVHQTARRAP